MVTFESRNFMQLFCFMIFSSVFSNYFSVIVGDLEIHLLLKSSSSNQTWNQSVWLCCCGFIVPSGKPFSLELVPDAITPGCPGCHGLSIGISCPSPSCSGPTPTQQQTFLHLPSTCSPNPLVPNSPVRCQTPLPHGWHSLPKSPAPLFPGSRRHPAACELVSPWAPGQHLSGPVCNMWSASGPASLLLPPWGSSFKPQSSSHLPCFRHDGFSLPLSSSLLSL